MCSLLSAPVSRRAHKESGFGANVHRKFGYRRSARPSSERWQTAASGDDQPACTSLTHTVSTLMPEAGQYQRPDGTCPFRDAFTDLRDARAQAKVDTTVRKLERGLRPDVKAVGEGVQEARIDYGPGYRVYFGIDGTELVILLLCGDKTTQTTDIANAKVYWTEYQTRKKALPPKKSHPPTSPAQPLLRTD